MKDAAVERKFQRVSCANTEDTLLLNLNILCNPVQDVLTENDGCGICSSYIGSYKYLKTS